MTDMKQPSSSVAAFTEALHGEQGALAAWLEANDEREVVAHIEAYARANVAVATAALRAEIERLRAEVERLRADRDSWEQQASDRVADRYRQALEGLRERCAQEAERITARRRAVAAMANNEEVKPCELAAAIRKIDVQQYYECAAREIKALRAERDALEAENERLAELLGECYEWLFESMSDGPRVSEGALTNGSYTRAFRDLHEKLHAVLHPTAAQENDDA